MKSLIAFTIMAIIVIAGQLAVYEPREDKPKPVSQSTNSVVKPVILHRIKRENPMLELFADDGRPINETIRRREAIASMNDNNTSMARRRVYAAR